MHPVRIGPYLIDRKIGAGGMGNVYLARHEETGDVVAVKELPASLAREDGFVHRFNREIEAMRKLSCPNIVKLIDSGSADDTYYYSMEYVDGETLTSKLRREKRIPWPEAVGLAKQICTGLKHAHDAGVVHRDLKPSNLMISNEGVVKIADFGVAQVFAADRLTSTGGIIGTAEFMSPEQVKGARTDKRTDLYSLGAVIYTMLVGQPPFLGTNASDVMQKQRFGRFDPPKAYVTDIPSWLDELVCQLLEKEPDKRPPDAFVTSRKLQEVANKFVLQEDSSIVSTSDVTRVDPSAAQPAIGATFVRDLMIAEASRGQPTTWLGRAMNNTWVLVLTLILVVGLVVLLISRPYWQGASVNETTDEPMQSLTESKRIVQRARRLWKSGDLVGALVLLDALEAVIESDPAQKGTLKSIDVMRKAIANESNHPDQIDFVEDALNRADELFETDRERARTIYEGIVTLYRSDRQLQRFVERARKQLQRLNEPVGAGP